MNYSFFFIKIVVYLSLGFDFFYIQGLVYALQNVVFQLSSSLYFVSGLFQQNKVLYHVLDWDTQLLDAQSSQQVITRLFLYNLNR